MVNLEGAGINAPPPMAQDAFERVWLVGLNMSLEKSFKGSFFQLNYWLILVN